MTAPKPESVGVPRLSWLLLAFSMLASAWLLRRAKPHALVTPREVELTQAVPAGPSLLVTVDVAGLGASAAQELLRAGAGSLLGLRELCGFEPLLGLRKVAFVVPPSEAGASPDFALIAETTLEPEPVLRCAEAVIRKRGGTPARSQLGAFQSVRSQAKPLGEVAIRADGLFVLSGGQYFRAVIDAASGTQVADDAARLRSSVHAAVRRKLGPNQLVLSALPGSLLPLPGVHALGFGLNVQTDVLLHGALYCQTAANCREAQGLLQRLLADVAKEPGLSALAQLSIVQHDAELDVSGRFPRERLGPLLSQLLAP
jgi:hypothetical protein